MQFIRPVTNYLKNQKHKALSFFVAFAGALLIYISFFQRNFFSKTYLAITAATFFLGLIVFNYINKLLVIPFISSKKSNVQGLYLAALMISAMLLINFRPQALLLLMPSNEFRISISAGDMPENEPIYLESVENSLGYIPYSQLSLKGDYEILDDSIRINPGTDFSLEWKGKFGKIY